MSSEQQEVAAKRNLKKARSAQSARATGRRVVRPKGLSAAEEDRIRPRSFAFPKERKEPLIDAAHVRNAIARFNQVEGVTDRERDEAWKRIRAAARRYDVEVSVRGWPQLSGEQHRNS